MSAGQVVALPGPMDHEQEEERHPQPARLAWLDEEAQPLRIPAQPEERGIDRPQGRQQDDQEETGVIQEGLAEFQVYQITRATRAAAAETRQAGQPDEDAWRELQAGKEPAPREDPARDERRRPDELVIELAGKGRSADQAQHRQRVASAPRPAHKPLQEQQQQAKATQRKMTEANTIHGSMRRAPPTARK